MFGFNDDNWGMSGFASQMWELDLMEQDEKIVELESAGISFNELEQMDYFDRRDTLELAGFDPDDYEELL